MKRLFTSILCLGFALPAIGQQGKATEKPAVGGLPPIVDRELFFGNPEITAAQISPNGKFVTFLKPWKDTRNVYVKGVDEAFSAARLLTTETKRPIPGYFWTRDSKYVLYVKDNDGDEKLQYLRS